MKLFPVGTLTVRVSFTGIQVNHHIPSPGYRTNLCCCWPKLLGTIRLTHFFIPVLVRLPYDSESLQNSLEEVKGGTFIPTAKISSWLPQRRNGNQKFQENTDCSEWHNRNRAFPQHTRGVVLVTRKRRHIWLFLLCPKFPLNTDMGGHDKEW